jgi:hypothetical protein
MLPHRAGSLAPYSDPAVFQKLIDSNGWSFEWTTGTLYHTPQNDGAAFVNSSRAAMLVIGVLLGAALAAWSWQLAGAAAAVVACFLFSFDPNFLGHAPLVKNDVSLTLVMFVLCWATWSLGKQARGWNLAAVLLLCGAAVNVKFSGVLMGPMLALLLVGRAVLPDEWIFLGKSLETRLARLLAAAGVCAAAGIVSVGMIWASYGFRFDPTPIPGAMLNMPEQIRMLREAKFHVAQYPDWPNEQQLSAIPDPLIGKAVLFAEQHRLLPQAWLYGFLFTYRTTLSRDTFLLGQHGELGWWYYFPLAMLFKTPLATLGAITIAAIVLLKGAARSLNRWNAVCILIPLLLYGASALTTHLNLGLRHVFPLYPFIYLLVGLAAARLRGSAPVAFKWLAPIVVVGLLAESLAAFPHYISFFNAPARPFRLKLLSDSNFDWGQDLTYVAEWQQKNPGVRLYLAYFGTVDPEFYGINYTNLPSGFRLNRHWEWPTQPGVMAISATLLQGVNCPPSTQSYYAPLREIRPRAILGDTIYLFDWPPASGLKSSP